MARRVIGSQAFASEISNILNEYGEDIQKSMAPIVKEVGDETAKRINANADQVIGRKTGRYKRSWTMTMTEKSLTGNEAVVHSKDYRKAHLLEFGHATRSGGRTRAFEHIAPEETWAINQLERKIMEKLQ